MTKPRFTHLHGHSRFSIGDATTAISTIELGKAGKIVGMVERAKALDMSAIALTDHGTMAGIAELMKACKKEGIKGIIGIEFYVAHKTAKEGKSFTNPSSHLICLASDLEGYRNLCALVEWSNRHGFSYSPRIDLEILSKHSKGLIGSGSCLGGVYNKVLLGWRGKVDGEETRQAEDPAGAEEKIGQLKDVFGKDRFYLEIMNHRMKDPSKLAGKELEDYEWMVKAQATVARASLELSRKLEIPCIGTNDFHYSEASMADTRQIALAMRNISESEEAKVLPWGFTGFLADPDIEEKRKAYVGLREMTGEMYVKSPAEMYETLHGRDHPELLANTVFIEEMCDVDLAVEEDAKGIKKFDLPKIELKDETSSQMLLRLCVEGLIERYGNEPAARERLDHELGVIEDLHLVDYHLVVWDIVAEARRRAILCGPGRGSAGGSVVCYCLGITDIDPIRHKLSFSRYLNAERISAADIDIDFDPERVDEVIKYLQDKYGEEQVALIAAYGEMHIRSAIRKIGTALGLHKERLDQLASAMPKEEGDHRLRLAEVVADPRSRSAKAIEAFIREGGEMADKMISLCLRMDGVLTHRSNHAAGVVVAGTPIRNKAPIVGIGKREDGEVTEYAVEYAHTHLEDIGLLKMDLLSIDGLTIIQKALDSIHRTDPGFHIPPERELAYDDPGAFQVLCAGDTHGVWQMSSAEMRELCIRLEPKSLAEIAAITALYRPGPLDFIDPDTGHNMVEMYLLRKWGKLPVKYDHPVLESILKDTYGVIVFQEQITAIAEALCGWSSNKADHLRKAVGKKLAKKIEEQKKLFIPAVMAHSKLDKALTERIWGQLETFGLYGFNAAHSFGYGKLAYVQALIKSRHPSHYLAACLSVLPKKSGDKDKILALLHAFVDECNRKKIRVLGPDAVLSRDETSEENGDVRLGFMAIAGIKKIAKKIIEAKVDEKDDLKSAIKKLAAAGVGPAVMKNMAKAGCFDRFGERNESLSRIETYGKSKTSKKKLAAFFDLDDGVVAAARSNEEMMLDAEAIMNLARKEVRVPHEDAMYFKVSSTDQFEAVLSGEGEEKEVFLLLVEDDGREELVELGTIKIDLDLIKKAGVEIIGASCRAPTNQ